MLILLKFSNFSSFQRIARPQAYVNENIAKIFEMVVSMVLNAAIHITIKFKDISKQVENGYLFNTLIYDGLS